jgi:hypothetical protein
MPRLPGKRITQTFSSRITSTGGVLDRLSVTGQRAWTVRVIKPYNRATSTSEHNGLSGILPALSALRPAYSQRPVPTANNPNKKRVASQQIPTITKQAHEFQNMFRQVNNANEFLREQHAKKLAILKDKSWYLHICF